MAVSAHGYTAVSGGTDDAALVWDLIRTSAPRVLAMLLRPPSPHQ